MPDHDHERQGTHGTLHEAGGSMMSRARLGTATAAIFLVFTNNTAFRGASENLHLTERFTRIDNDTLQYRVTVDDPNTFTRPWTIELPAVRMDAEIYEYACHEGNYAMRNLLSASRVAEKQAAEKR